MKAIGATFCPTDGHANPFKTTFAYADAARKLGAEINTHTTVIDVKTTQKKIRAIVTDKKTIQTNVVVNAAGIDSKAIAEMVKVKLPLTPLRKEIMATERLQPLFEAMVISFKDGIYFSQQKEGQIVGGIPIPEEKPRIQDDANVCVSSAYDADIDEIRSDIKTCEPATSLDRIL